ncbi:MAG: TonB-dependent receptor [Sphingomonas sp.]|uniref:TonB-dependent receptor domain-containing protein n=1 Tax=Sphingomonas sp. TaxID=28214 RepID=UPI002273A13B|nr:TonB-dependent receptor [Sphingomonas sp.]MCX8475797.1 TonB-dependent receptor [Sphingomonas sp.]
MTRQIAFATLLAATTQLVSPAALAQVAGTAPSDQTAPPSAPAADPAVTQDVPEAEPEVSAPGFDPGAGEEIVVTGRNIPNVVRATPQVVSVLSTEDIARTGEGDIAGALTRVTGLSVVGNGFVFVRGLGDRYSSSLLNGSPLPSPEPLRRTVPLDIFPTTIVGSALVQKTYSVNYAGEFGGGVINLTTRAVPEESFVQVGGSLGYDSATTNQFGYVYDGGRLDSLGYDTGERDMPAFIRLGGLNTSVFYSSQVAQLTNAETTLLQRNDHIPVNWNGEISAGHTLDVSGVRLGIIATASLGNSFLTREAVQQDTADQSGALRSDFRTVLTDNRITNNGMFGLGAEFGEHKIRWTTLYIHDTLKQARLSAATVYPNSSGDAVLQQNTNWFERQLIDTQLATEFKFDDFTVDLRGSFANTQRNAPYERFFSYRLDPVRNAYVNSLNGLGESATIAFSELDEDLWSAQADFGYKLPFARPVTVSAGYYFSDAQRQSTRFDFRYRSFDGGSIPAPASYLRPDMLLSIDSIMNACVNPTTVPEEDGCIRLFNLSNAQGAAEYNAQLRINAGYVQLEGELADGLRATAGVRYEKGEQSVTTNSALFQGTHLNNGYWLPAATITWNFAQDMQFRLHGSKTIARPQFRELAPQVYRDFESDRLFFGNPELVDAKLLNFEGRWEWFFGRNQRITAAGFYKKIDNPTEQVAFFPTPDSALQTGFSYAPSATLWGGEVEVQKYFPLEFLGAGRRLMLVANYTYTKSSINSDDTLVPSPIQNGSGVAVLVPATQLFRDGAPLTGQSDHLVNVQVGIEDTDSLSQLTLLFNYASDRVTNRGANLLPDIVERPGIRLDLVARQGLTLGGVDFELKLEGRNLTGTRYREFQQFEAGTVDINRYRLGRVFSAGLTAKF